MGETIFAQGMVVKQRDNAPAFVVCSLSIKVDEFIATLQQHRKGEWVNIEILRGKTPPHRPYAAIDQWEPNTQQPQQQPQQPPQAPPFPGDGMGSVQY